MLAIETTHLCTWRGCTIQLFPREVEYFVYLLCYAKTPYKHAKHYLGCTTALDNRLYAHAHGGGARLTQVLLEHDISWELSRLWPCATYEEMRALERRLKGWHGSGALCPECNPHLPKDALVELRKGHYPFQLFDKPGKRRPMHS